MKGDNPLLVAQEDGHSVDTMLRTYAAWIKGAKPEDLERIKKAMEGCPQANEADRIPRSPRERAPGWHQRRTVEGVALPGGPAGRSGLRDRNSVSQGEG